MRYKVEWRYFSGRMEDGKHFHYAEFRKKDRYFRHWSVNGKFYEDEQEMGDDFHIITPQFNYNFKPISNIIEHTIPHKEYYTIPRLTNGKIEVWFDHEKMIEAGSDWEWLGCNLDCGMTLVTYQRKDEKYCDLTFNNKTLIVNSILDGKHFFIYETGMYLMADDSLLIPPSTQSIIHRPKNGRPYSEWAFNVISKGEVIGHGVREKTYKQTEV